MCLYKPLSNHSTPQQQVVRFSFAPRLKGFNDVQQLQMEALATPESTLVNVSLSAHSHRHSEECIKSDGGCEYLTSLFYTQDAVRISTSSFDLILFSIWDQWKKHVISCKIWNFHSIVGEHSVWDMMLCWLVFSSWCQGCLLPLKCHLTNYQISVALYPRIIYIFKLYLLAEVTTNLLWHWSVGINMF